MSKLIRVDAEVYGRLLEIKHELERDAGHVLSMGAAVREGIRRAEAEQARLEEEDPRWLS